MTNEGTIQDRIKSHATAWLFVCRRSVCSASLARAALLAAVCGFFVSCAPPSFWLSWHVDRTQETPLVFEALQEQCHGYETADSCRAMTADLCREHHAESRTLSLRALSLRRYEEARSAALSDYPDCDLPAEHLDLARLADSLATCEGEHWVSCERDLFAKALGAKRHEPGVAEILALRAERFCEDGREEFIRITQEAEPDPFQDMDAFLDRWDRLGQAYFHVALYCRERDKEPVVSWLTEHVQPFTPNKGGTFTAWRLSRQWQMDDPGEPRLERLGEQLAHEAGRALWALAQRQVKEGRPSLALLLVNTLQAYSLPVEPDWDWVRQVSDHRGHSLRRPLSISFEGEAIPESLAGVLDTLKADVEESERWAHWTEPSLFFGDSRLHWVLEFNEEPSAREREFEQTFVEAVPDGMETRDDPRLENRRITCAAVREQCRRCEEKAATASQREASSGNSTASFPPLPWFAKTWLDPLTPSFWYAPGLAWAIRAAREIRDETRSCDKAACSRSALIEACTIPQAWYASVYAPRFREEQRTRIVKERQLRLTVTPVRRDAQSTRFEPSVTWTTTQTVALPSPGDEPQAEAQTADPEEDQHETLASLVRPFLLEKLLIERESVCQQWTERFDALPEDAELLERDAARVYLGCSLSDMEKETFQRVLRRFLLTH